jgi:hypothetical protein
VCELENTDPGEVLYCKVKRKQASHEECSEVLTYDCPERKFLKKGVKKVAKSQLSEKRAFHKKMKSYSRTMV